MGMMNAIMQSMVGRTIPDGNFLKKLKKSVDWKCFESALKRGSERLWKAI